jgi:hypothetical protein
MQLTATSPLYMTLTQNGVDNIYDLVAINVSEIVTFTYQDADNNTKSLPRGAVEMFRSFISFILHRAANGNAVTDNDWLTLEAREFNDYRISPDFIASISGAPTVSVRPNAPSAASIP